MSDAQVFTKCLNYISFQCSLCGFLLLTVDGLFILKWGILPVRSIAKIAGSVSGKREFS